MRKFLVKFINIANDKEEHLETVLASSHYEAMMVITNRNSNNLITFVEEEVDTKSDSIEEDT